MTKNKKNKKNTEKKTSDKKIHDTGFGNAFSDMTRKGSGNQRKNKQIGFHENFKILSIKIYYQPSNKATHRMAGNICTSSL